MSLSTGKQILRRSWDAIPMSDTVIARVNALGADQPEELTFLDRHGRLIGDNDTPGMSVEYRPTTAPESEVQPAQPLNPLADPQFADADDFEEHPNPVAAAADPPCTFPKWTMHRFLPQTTLPKLQEWLRTISMIPSQSSQCHTPRPYHPLCIRRPWHPRVPRTQRRPMRPADPRGSKHRQKHTSRACQAPMHKQNAGFQTTMAEIETTVPQELGKTPRHRHHLRHHYYPHGNDCKRVKECGRWLFAHCTRMFSCECLEAFY
jgi:hypothetical protein